MKNVIEFNNVWKKFKRGEKFNSLRDAIPAMIRQAGQKTDELAAMEFWALQNVDFNIRQGEVVGIMGPNGAGKSTILKLLSRIIVPNQGSMKINGRLSALIEVTAGFHPELTGRENVYLNGTILGMKRKEIDARFDDIVEFSGIKEFIDTPVKRYSSGMYSRLGFSVAAHMNPEILLIDEVLAVGDMAFQSKCAQKMRDLLKSGATIVLVSHQLNLLQSLCKRAILLQHGKVLKDGPIDDVIPVYQNIVFAKNESDLKKKVTSDEKVRVDTSTAVSIDDVRIFDQNGQKRESFAFEDMITIEFDVNAKEKIQEPVFIFEIMRADGVSCCVSYANQKQEIMESMSGRQTMKINLGKLNLSPGIYATKISVWDQGLIHPFVVRKKDVFRIEVNASKLHSDAVFLPPMEWKLK